MNEFTLVVELLAAYWLWLAWRSLNNFIIERMGYQWFYRNVYLRMPSWRLARRVKFLFSGRQCRVCGETRWLDVHHRSYAHRWLEWLFPWELEVLCRKHHRTKHPLTP